MRYAIYVQDTSNEDLCMHDSGCDSIGDWYLQCDDDWHDKLLCDKHKTDDCIPNNS